MNKVKRFRKNVGETVVDFAKGIGYSESIQRKIECGARPASKKYITNFKEKYPDADINYIFFTK